MSFEVVFSPRARKDLAALPLDAQRRVVVKLDEARMDPARFFRRLTGVRAFRMRVGDHRVIADVDGRAKRISVLHVGHRRDIYD